MQTIKRVSVVQQAEDQIREYILSEDVKIGDKLPPEKYFCEKMEIGRGSVREAIRSLEAKGLIKVEQGRGAYVVRKHEVDLEGLAGWFRDNEVEQKDFIEVRMAIEPLAIRFAIERCSDEEIQNLEQIHLNMIKAAEEKDSERVAVCDEDFHSYIVECSHSSLLVAINREIVKALKQFREQTFQIDQNIENCIPYHAAILDAVKERDVATAQEMLIKHLEQVESDFESSKLIESNN